MYVPNLTPRDSHRLWLEIKDEQGDANPSIQSFSSYSAAYPGSLNLVRLDQYKQKELFKPMSSRDKIDPSWNVENLIHSEYLDSFSRLGYSTLKPIGLNKTMEQLDEERQELEELRMNSNHVDFYGNEEEDAMQEEEEERSANHHDAGGVSLASVGNAAAGDPSFDLLLAENTRSNNTSAVEASNEADDQYQFRNNQDFMAEDEEYQDDHSISIDSDNSRRIVRSAGAQVFSSGHVLPIPAQGSHSYRRQVSNSSASLRNEVRISSGASADPDF